MAESHKMINSQDNSFPHLSNAPIIEAIIDLRVDAAEEWDPELFQKALSKDLPDYPDVAPQRLFQGEFRTKMNELPQAAMVDLGLKGFFFRTQDGLQVAQFQKDGFAYSRLRPYQDWDNLVGEAHRLWNIYQQHIVFQHVLRLGVRFINRMEAPLTGDISNYLKNMPFPDFSAEWSFKEFLHRDAFDIPDSPYTAILTCAMKPELTCVAFIVDVDVFTTSELDSEQIWGKHLVNMRTLKNKMFFGTVSRSAWEGML